MALSSETFHKLSQALTPEVIDYIHEDERYVIFMQEIIPDALTKKMGQLEENLLFELSLSIMDSIFLHQ